MRTFLTGGTGLIGSHVAERLRARGDEVAALVRESSDTGHLRELGCELVTGDLMDPVAEMTARMRGADNVVHTAAKVFRAGSRAEFLRVNVEGTERILKSAAVAAPRLVHLSSVAVYAGLPMDRPLTEERWTQADPERQTRYPASKHLSERSAWRAHDAGSIRLTTLRPSVVYGERDRAATPAMVRYATLPLVPLIGGGRTTVPLVYAGNVAAAVVAALDRNDAVGRAYNVALDTPVTTRDLTALVARGLGRRARTVAVPRPAARGLVAALEALTRSVPGARTVDGRRGVSLLSHDNPYDSTRARLELGWTGHVSHEEGVRRTMEWWRERERAADD